MNLFLIGYSGHAFVVADSASSAGFVLKGYYENEKKTLDPFRLEYLGSERGLVTGSLGKDDKFIIGIGDNFLRKKIFEALNSPGIWTNVIDQSANLSSDLQIGKAVYIGKNAIVNPLVKIGDGAIINTRAIVEHECKVGAFAHIAPGSVLCGNVIVGEGTLIGAGSTVIPGIKIGSNVIIGAGSLVNRDIPDNSMAFGNPAKIVKTNL